MDDVPDLSTSTKTTIPTNLAIVTDNVADPTIDSKKLHDQISPQDAANEVIELISTLIHSNDCQQLLRATIDLKDRSPRLTNSEIRDQVPNLQDGIARLLGILADHEDQTLQVSAMSTLGRFASDGGTILCEKIWQSLSQLGLVESVLQSLEDAIVESSEEGVQIAAAELLALLAMSVHDDPNLCQNICKIPECITLHILMLAKYDEPLLQMHAARALLCFTRRDGQYVSQQITNEPLATEILGHAIGRSSDVQVRILVLNFISLLAEIGGQELCERMTEAPELVANLLAGLVESDLQFSAAEALISLTSKGGPKTCNAITCARQSLEEIGDAVTASQEADVQLLVVRVIALLALNGGSVICLKISKTSQCITRIVDALGRCNFPYLQLSSAQVLMCLAGRGGEETCQVLGESDSTIHAIVNSLFRKQNPEVQVLAAETLALLAQNGGEKSCQNISTALESRKKSFEKLALEEHSPFQLPVARTLKFLVEHGGKNNWDKIAKDNTTIQKYGHMIAKSSSSEVQTLAIQTVEILIPRVDEDACKRICDTPGMLTILIDALAKQHLQLHAAGILKALATKGGEYTCGKIANANTAIQKIGHAVVTSSIREVQALATQTIGLIASNGGKDVCRKICQTPEALTILVDALAETNLQLAAAKALESIANAGGGDACHAIANVKNTMEMLGAVAEGGIREAQTSAAKVLESLVSHGDAKVCEKMSRTPPWVRGLVKALRLDDSPDLQGYSARTLKSLAENVPEARPALDDARNHGGCSREVREKTKSPPQVLDGDRMEFPDFTRVKTWVLLAIALVISMFLSDNDFGWDNL